MPRLDPFILAMQKLRGDLVLVPGKPVTIAAGAERRPVSAQAATQAQIEELVKEVLPADRVLELRRDGSHDFRYASPHGPVEIRMVRGQAGLRVQVSAAGPPLAAAPPAAAAAAPGAPIAIEGLFRRMVAEKCSDLHLSAGNAPLVRRDGVIGPLGDGPRLGSDQIRDLLLSIAPPANRVEFEEAQDTDFAHEIPGLARFRCNLFVDLQGVGGVFRVVPSRIPTAEELGLPRTVLELCALPKGLVLVTGPTGSGKSTTLAAMIDHVNRSRSAHIITIEDPIEFVHPSRTCLINQREVGRHTRGFKQALRAALREDPDIVMVGEMRDLETVAIALETAETGHLVFGTLHTNTAPSTVDRIIDQFPADRQSQVRTMLSESLKGVITQTLVRRREGGRIAALEVLVVTPAIANIIREGKSFQIPSLMQTGRAQGMTTMNDALLDLVKRQLVDPAEALAKSVAPAELKALLARKGVAVEA